MGAAAAIAGAAVAGVAGAAISASAQSGAASDAANAQIQAANTAANTQTSMYNQTVAREQPWVTAGTNAVNTLSGQMGQLTTPYSLQSYYNSPEYAAQMAATGQQSNKLQALAAAGGAYGSGNMASALASNAQQNALAGYTTGLQDYWGQNQNIYNMYSNLSGQGQAAAGNLAATGTQVANAIGNTQMAAGQAAAQGYLGSANALSAGVGGVTGSITGALNAYNQNQLYQNYQNTGGYSTGYMGSVPTWDYSLNTYNPSSSGFTGNYGVDYSIGNQ